MSQQNIWESIQKEEEKADPTDAWISMTDHKSRLSLINVMKINKIRVQTISCHPIATSTKKIEYRRNLSQNLGIDEAWYIQLKVYASRR